MWWIKALFLAPWKLDRGTRKWAVRTAAYFGLALLGFLLFVVLAGATHTPSADDPTWELALKARLVVVKFGVAIALLLSTVAVAYGLFQWVEASSVGKRYMVWDLEKDHEMVKSNKTLNGGLVLAALIVAASTIFAAVL